MRSRASDVGKAASGPAAASTPPQARAAPGEDGKEGAAADFRCLNGLRALACIAVVCYHSLFFWTILAEPTQWFVQRDWFVVLVHSSGALAVDFFLVVTALLATYQLVPLLEGASEANSSTSGGTPSCLAVVLAYWRRRALRLLPAYAATNLLILLALPSQGGLRPEVAAGKWTSWSCPAGLWRNAVFISDAGPGCGAHLWSLSVQVQFYLTFPMLLVVLGPRRSGFRARLAAAVAAAAMAGTAWRLYQAFTAPHLRLPIGHVWSIPAEAQVFVVFCQAAYYSTANRVVNLAFGAAVGLLLLSKQALAWLKHRRALLAVVALALYAAALHVVSAWRPFAVTSAPEWQPLHTRLFAALLSYGSPFMAALVSAALLALMLHSDPLHTMAAAVLGSCRFSPLVSLSYCTFLIHELARLWGIVLLLPAGMLPALVSASPLAGLLFSIVFTLAVSLPCAYLLHVLVERRF